MYGRLEGIFREAFAGEDVLEIACGTGHWTTVLAEVADAVVGVDAEPLARARSREYAEETPVHPLRADAYRPPVSGEFSAGFAGFWWSHVPLSRREEFLRRFHDCLEPGATVCTFDNLVVEGEVEPDVTDDAGNTYEIRDDAGSGEHRVLENFPGEGELRRVVGEHGSALECRTLARFRCLSYTV